MQLPTDLKIKFKETGPEPLHMVRSLHVVTT